MVDFINANPQIDGVFTINDPTARGAIAALKEAGRLDQTKVVSIDGSDEGKGFIRAGEMVASAAQDPGKNWADPVLKQLIRYWQERKLKKKSLFLCSLLQKRMWKNPIT